jgi:hypothetical protein
MKPTTPPPSAFRPSRPIPRALFPPRSLSALAGPPISAAALRAPAPAFPSLSARGPGLSAPSSPRNRRPSCALPQTPRPRRAWSSELSHPWPLEPRTPLALSPSLFCAPAAPSSTSPSLRARPSAAATNHRRPELVSRPPLELRRVRCHGELRPGVRNPGHTPISSPPPYFLRPRSPAVPRAAAEVRHRRPGPPSCHCRRRGVPEVRLEVRNLSRPLPTFVLPPVALDCSPESFSAATEPLRREPPPSGAPAPTQTPPEDPPCPPQPSRPLRSPQRPAKRPRPSSPASPPLRGRAPPPQLAVGEAQAGHPIPTVRPRSGGPVLIRSSLIPAVRRRSNGPGPLPPHPVSLPFGSRLSARALALPAGPNCQPTRSLCPPVPPVSPRARAARRSRLSAARSRARPRI